MENLTSEIEYLKGLTPADIDAIGKHSYEMKVTYEGFKEDTNNFEETELFEIVEEMGETLVKWVNTVKKIKEKYPEDFETQKEDSRNLPEPKFKVGDKVIHDGSLEAVIERIVYYDTEEEQYVYAIDGKFIHANSPERRLVLRSKARAKQKSNIVDYAETTQEKERKNEEKRMNAIQNKIAKKRDELNNLQNIVRSNAAFKEKIASEMQAHLHSVGLSGLGRKDDELTPNELITRLDEKIKFYKNLIRGDKADFKAIAKRIGLDFRKSTPRKKKTIEDEGLQGLGRPKSKNLWGKFVDWFND